MTLDSPDPDRVRGALIGLAVGDAVGAAVEFRPRGTFAPLTEMVAGGPHHLEKGQFTDDTSMALCLAESLLHRGGMDPRDQMDRYIAWRDRGHLSATGHCFDIGITTNEALHRYQRTGDPLAGSEDPRRSGNGSIMRLAPVVMYHAREPRRAIEAAALSSRTTHGSRLAVDACRYMAALLVGAMHGVPKDELLGDAWSPLPGLWDEEPLAPEVLDVARGSFLRKSPDTIRGSGFVIASLEAALWSFASTDSFRHGCLAAANLGDDADTTAAVYGQIAGAFHGAEAIPRDWRDAVNRWGPIEDMADRLAEACIRPN